jgi:hypothetical protein
MKPLIRFKTPFLRMPRHVRKEESRFETLVTRSHARPHPGPLPGGEGELKAAFGIRESVMADFGCPGAKRVNGFACCLPLPPGEGLRVRASARKTPASTENFKASLLTSAPTDGEGGGDD